MRALIQRYDNRPDILCIKENGCSDVYSRSVQDDFDTVIVVPTNGANTEVAVVATATSRQYTPLMRGDKSWPGRPDQYPVRVDVADVRYVTRKQVRGAIEAAGHSWGGAWVVRVLDLDPGLLTLSDTPPPEPIDEPLPPGPGVEVVNGVDIMPGEKAPKQPHLEGDRQQVLVNRYERNPKARSKCIRHYGPICQACDADFEQLYGRFAKGFIHVHHLNPLGKSGGPHEVDPVKDLVPVCPNCHAVIHMPKGKPPFTIQQVRRFIRLHRPRV